MQSGKALLARYMNNQKNRKTNGNFSVFEKLPLPW
ncbi:hypothetical protein RB2150_00649 [Rhodobacterales bacterium HTCC2150]|nr:hypothetical protein RB2150_00649 [Rhodobacterales bacterium HTCC2150] [Rhodobacteraceae bacterium HTCC2150]